MTSAPSRAAIEAQLQRLVASAAFSTSGRLTAFLSFVVRETLEGRGAGLKESGIGDAVYPREEGYDPRIDSTVRVEARRLRRKLDQYYASEGRADPVRVRLPIGGYVPVFEAPQAEAALTGAEPDAGLPVFEKGSGAALAIMPFRSLSADPADEHFADGLTDELIYAMSSAAGLRVVSRAVAFQYKQRPYAPSAVANELDVDVVMQGTVRRRGGEIRVTVELSDPSGFVVCSDRFDAPADDASGLQEQIAATLFSRTRLDSSMFRARRIAAASPLALQANASIYRARQLLDEQTPRGVREALALFTEVADKAPGYARGFSGIADAACDLFRLGALGLGEADALARPAAARALAIDPDSVEAHTAAATVSAWFDRDAAAAEARLETAMALGGNARAARLYGVCLALWGRMRESDERLRQARRLEPFSTQQDVAESLCHFQSRRLDALRTAVSETTLQRLPLDALHLKALAFALDGQADEARRMAQRLRHPDDTPHLALAAAEIEALLGDPDAGRAALAAPPPNVPGFALAALAAAVDDEQACRRALDTAFARGELATAWLRTDLRFDRYRACGWFAAALARLDTLAKRPH